MPCLSPSQSVCGSTLASSALILLDALVISNSLLGASTTPSLYSVQETIYSLNPHDYIGMSA